MLKFICISGLVFLAGPPDLRGRLLADPLDHAVVLSLVNQIAPVAENYPEALPEEVLQSIDFVRNGTGWRWLLTQRPEAHGSCRTCGTPVSFLRLRREGNDWRIEALDRDFLKQGMHGLAYAGELTRIGPQQFGVLFESGAGNRGYYDGQRTLVYEVSGALRQLRITETSGDNSGACGVELDVACYSYDSQLRWLPQTGFDYHEFELHSRGTDDSLRAFERIRRFGFRDDRYVQLADERVTQPDAGFR